MDRLATVVALALACMSGAASAGYAQLSPPAGWVSGAGATYGTIPARLGTAAANGGSFWSGSTVINAAGRSVTIPVAGRFAANAGRFAARGLALNPLAIGIAGAAWLASECIAYKGGQFEFSCGGGGAPVVPSDGKLYRIQAGPIFNTPSAACEEFAGRNPPGWAMFTFTGLGPYDPNAGGYYCLGMRKSTQASEVEEIRFGPAISQGPSDCPAGWYITPAGCVQDKPKKILTPQEVEEIMAPKIIPPGVFPEIPNIPLPIDIPKINPTPAPDFTPQPMIVPLGDPVSVPNSNPKRWTQPEVQITPAPSPDSPFRVDIKPQDRPVGDPVINPPKRDPWTPPVTPPITDPNDPPLPDPPDPPIPRTPDLCEKYPDILACAKFKLGEVEEQKVKNTEVPLKIEKEGGFPSGGQCPAPKVVPLMGKSFAFSIEPLCDFAKAIKPLLLGFAYLTAALTFLGVARRE